MFLTLSHLEKQKYVVSGSASLGQWTHQKYNKRILSSPQRSIILEMADMLKLPWLFVLAVLINSCTSTVLEGIVSNTELLLLETRLWFQLYTQLFNTAVRHDAIEIKIWTRTFIKLSLRLLWFVAKNPKVFHVAPSSKGLTETYN